MKTYGVILAGGSGSRLWPLSSDSTPKHLLTLGGQESLLVQTVRRLLPQIPPRQIVVVTHCEQQPLVARHLDAVGPLLTQNILAEPERRNTLPAIIWAVSHILKREADALIGVFPSDHRIENIPAFWDAVEKGLQAARENFLVTFGIPPTRPATGFGYIQQGKERIGDGAWKIARFTEKPDAKTARGYLQSKDYFWNAGMFVFKASVFLKEVQKYQPALLMEKNYSRLPNLSVDVGIFEKSKQGAVLPAAFGWNDLGSWEAVYESSPKDHRQNVCEGEVFASDTEGCLLHSQDGVLATIGLKNAAVIQTKEGCLVARRDCLEEVKKMAEQFKGKKTGENRPWGSFIVLEEGPGYKVKRITVKPGQILSLQSHQRRAEHWTVVVGAGRVTVGEKVVTLKPNETIHIPKKAKHRIENPGKELLQFIEVQVGDYLGEDDIVRFEDKYGRA